MDPVIFGGGVNPPPVRDVSAFIHEYCNTGDGDYSQYGTDDGDRRDAASGWRSGLGRWRTINGDGTARLFSVGGGFYRHCPRLHRGDSTVGRYRCCTLIRARPGNRRERRIRGGYGRDEFHGLADIQCDGGFIERHACNVYDTPVRIDGGVPDENIGCCDLLTAFCLCVPSAECVTVTDSVRQGRQFTIGPGLHRDRIA